MKTLHGNLWSHNHSGFSGHIPELHSEETLAIVVLTI